MFQAPNNVVNYYIASYSLNREIFYVDPTSGQVFLRTSMIGTSIDRYNVSTDDEYYVNNIDKYCIQTLTRHSWIHNTRLLSCEIGGLDCHVITTEYRTRVRCTHV